MTGRLLSVRHGGLSVHVSVEGSGPPVLLVMGLGGNIEMWRPLRDHLPGVTTISYDAPGTGHSSKLRRPMAMVELGTVARRVIEATGHRMVDVIGYSFGGAVAQQLAIRSPDVVRRLVLVATNTGVVSVPPTPQRLMHMLSTRRYRSESYFRRIAPGLFGGRTAREPELVDAEYHARYAAPPSVAGYWAQLAAIGTWTSLPFLGLIRHPTLVLAGDDDRLVPLSNARLLACGIPDARLHVIPGAGHLLLMDDAERASRPIRDFLAS